MAVRCIELSKLPAGRITQRWLLLQRFNAEVEKTLPLAHTGWSAEAHTLGARLCALRGLVLLEVKRRVWDEALPAGPSDEGVVKSGHVISLNRFEAEAARAASAEERAQAVQTNRHKTLFEQAFAELHHLPPRVLRRRDRAFKVKFIGEASDDYGGPFREAITNMCAELQSAASALFVRTPNGQIGTGNNQSACTVRPSAVGADALAQFAFVGKIIGCAMLQREMVLDFELSAHVWKRLAGVELSEADLAAFDESALLSMRRMKRIDEDGIDEETFGELFFETFETRLSDGSSVELIEDGAATDVTFATRGRFAELAISARLAEGAAQCEALLAGVASVVPSARLLSLFTGRELERLTCGEADVDVAALKAHTSYGATAAAGMAHVRYFWAVLEAFTPEQRRLFLKVTRGAQHVQPCAGPPMRRPALPSPAPWMLTRARARARSCWPQFIWGRNRLPLTEEDWGDQRMRIHSLEKPNPNAYFPVAHTCFFSIELPKYTSRDVCYKRLLYAINSARRARLRPRSLPPRSKWLTASGLCAAARCDRLPDHRRRQHARGPREYGRQRVCLLMKRRGARERRCVHNTHEDPS